MHLTQAMEVVTTSMLTFVLVQQLFEDHLLLTLRTTEKNKVGFSVWAFLVVSATYKGLAHCF
jgi:hypothetical protein